MYRCTYFFTFYYTSIEPLIVFQWFTLNSFFFIDLYHPFPIVCFCFKISVVQNAPNFLVNHFLQNCFHSIFHSDALSKCTMRSSITLVLIFIFAYEDVKCKMFFISVNEDFLFYNLFLIWKVYFLSKVNGKLVLNEVWIGRFGGRVSWWLHEVNSLPSLRCYTVWTRASNRFSVLWKGNLFSR